MPDVHLTFELLAAADRGELTTHQITLLALEHLRALCPPCDVQVQAFLDAQRETRQAGAAGGQADRALAALSPRVRRAAARLLARLEGQVAGERSGADRDLAELVRRVDSGEEGPATERVERARTRFRSVLLGFRLLDETRASLPDRPRRALAFARLAERVALRLADPHRGLGPLRGEIGGLALAHQGNALRALDDLRAADAAFARARWLLDEWGVSDPATLGEVDALEGSLRRAQRRFGASERLLRRAAVHWTAAEEPLGLARTLVTLGSLYFHSGRPREAFAAAEAALAALPANAPARLRLCAAHNRVFYLCELGHFDLAAELLAEARPLYEAFGDPWTRLRLAWVEGRIAAGLGRREEAQERLEAVREGFAAAGATYDTALVSLELAELHLAAGRPAAARRVASETVPLFAALEVPRELAAALAQLRRAAAEEGALTAALLREVGRAVRRAQPGPSARKV
jgi:tetratricopeptide (TPR) repeat protein